MGSVGLLKNPHLLRCAHHSSLRRTNKYASFLMISCSLHLDVFEQPQENYFFNNPTQRYLLSEQINYRKLII